MCGNIIGCLISDKTIRGHYTDVGTLESTISVGPRSSSGGGGGGGGGTGRSISYWEHLLIRNRMFREHMSI